MKKHICDYRNTFNYFYNLHFAVKKTDAFSSALRTLDTKYRLSFCPSSQNHTCHWVKSIHIRSYSDPHFPAFGLNTERYSVSLCIHSKCGKIRTRITPNTYTFHSVCLLPTMRRVCMIL